MGVGMRLSRILGSMAVSECLGDLQHLTGLAWAIFSNGGASICN